MVKQSIGIDVSKDTLAVCFLVSQAGQRPRVRSTRTFANQVKKFEDLHTWIKQHGQAQGALSVVMEATGVYYEEVAYFLHTQGYSVSVLLPNKVKAFAKSLDYKSKNDAIDAKILAHMGLERSLEVWQPPGEALLRIKRLCRERVELVGEKTAVGNRLHAKEHARAGAADSLQRAQRLLTLLDEQLEEVEAAIEQAIEADAVLQGKVRCMCSIKGVGRLTAATILAETNGFALIRNKAQLVSYAGYDVVEHSSGTSVHTPGRISKKGNSHIRRALHFPALSAIKYEPTLNALYRRVYDRTRVKMKAAVAVQRKLLVLIYTLYRKNEYFDPQYQHAQPLLAYT